MQQKRISHTRTRVGAEQTVLRSPKRRRNLWSRL